MTPKEAFRVISHKFHGKGPGKMKQEKRMKQYHEELKLKQMKASDTPSESMERIRDAQAHLQTPYLVLSGHVKPGYDCSFFFKHLIFICFHPSYDLCYCGYIFHSVISGRRVTPEVVLLLLRKIIWGA